MTNHIALTHKLSKSAALLNCPKIHKKTNKKLAQLTLNKEKAAHTTKAAFAVTSLSLLATGIFGAIAFVNPSNKIAVAGAVISAFIGAASSACKSFTSLRALDYQAEIDDVVASRYIILRRHSDKSYRLIKEIRQPKDRSTISAKQPHVHVPTLKHFALFR